MRSCAVFAVFLSIASCIDASCFDGNNGGCSHICAGSVCSCPPCWTLNEDGKTCSISAGKAFVTCKNDGVEVVIDKCVASDVEQSMIHLRSSTCGAIEESDSKWKISAGFSDCGTEVSFVDNKLAVENQLMIGSAIIDGFRLKNKHEIGFTCKYNNVATASKSFNAVAESVVFDINEEAPAELSFGFILQPYESDDYTTVADMSTGSALIGSLLYLRVAPENELPESLEFSVHKCSVEDEDIDTKITILDSCPLFPGLNFRFKNEQSDQNAVDFSFTSFLFPTSAENTIIKLTCEINICPLNSAECLKSCSATTTEEPEATTAELTDLTTIEPTVIPLSCVHFERVSDETVDWFTAKDECENADGVLAYFDNSLEYDKFSQQIELGGSDEWLGIKRSSTHGWSTAKGTQNLFFQWATAADKQDPDTSNDEPNNHNGEEDCVEYHGSVKKWNDIPCQHEKRFACRFDTCSKSDVSILVITLLIDGSYLQRSDGTSQISASINTPRNLQYAAHALINGELHIFGGWSDGKKIARLDRCSFNELSARLSEERRASHAALSIDNGGKALVCFDWTDDTRKSCEIFDGSSTASTFATEWTHRDGGLGLYNSQPATVGCRDEKHQKSETLSATGWTALPDFPFIIERHSFVGLENGAMLLLGGYIWGSGIAQTGIWQLRADQWSRIGDFSKPASFGSAIYVSRSVYYFEYENSAIHRIDLDENEELEAIEEIGSQPGRYHVPVLLKTDNDYCI